jgi:hypothetical protein
MLYYMLYYRAVVNHDRPVVKHESAPCWLMLLLMLLLMLYLVQGGSDGFCVASETCALDMCVVKHA